MFTLGQYKVSFRHGANEEINLPALMRPVKGITFCNIINTSTSCVTQGVAFCSVHDQFNKAVGRKIALARALMTFDKETRTRFWDAYFQAGGKK